MTIDIDPVIVHLGPIALGWYGAMVAVAITAGVWLALREARRKGIDPAAVESLAFWVVVGGFIGARALHVIDRWETYSQQPLAVFAFWNGGLAILGAVLGGTTVGTLMAWDLGVLGLLLWLRPRLRIDGQLFALYLALYAVGKFALTFLRTEATWIGGLQEAQLLAVVALGVAGVWAWSARCVGRPSTAAA